MKSWLNDACQMHASQTEVELVDSPAPYAGVAREGPATPAGTHTSVDIHVLIPTCHLYSHQPKPTSLAPQRCATMLHAGRESRGRTRLNKGKRSGRKTPGNSGALQLKWQNHTSFTF